MPLPRPILRTRLVNRTTSIALALITGALVVSVSPVTAQELEPGAYQNAPIGVNVAIVSYGYSTGNVLVDAALPIEGANARVHTLVLAYLRTFSVFGLSSKIDAGVGVSHA